MSVTYGFCAGRDAVAHDRTAMVLTSRPGWIRCPVCGETMETAPDIGMCDLCGSEDGERRWITLANGLIGWVCPTCKGTDDQHAYDRYVSHTLEMDG